MEKITQAVSAITKKLHRPSAFTIEATLTFTFILLITFDFLGINGRYISASPWAQRLYILTMLLFVNMVHEDLKDLVVDVRKSVLLFVGLCICSNKTIIEFLILTAIGAVIFSLVYFAQLTFSSEQEEENQEEGESPIQVGFLPCFGATLFLFFICSYDSPPLNTLMGELTQFDLATYIVIYLFYANHVAFYSLLAVLLIAFAALIFRYWYNVNKKGRTIITEGFGAGDLSFLPSFFALLGSLDFTFVFFMSNVVVLMVHKNIEKYQEYQKWRKEHGN